MAWLHRIVQERARLAGTIADGVRRFVAETVPPGGDGRPTQKPRLPGIGTPTRIYVFTPKVWEGDV